MANWGSSKTKSDYSPFEKLHGACYYYTKQGWIKNENYKSVPELRFEQPAKSVPENMDFLKQG
jgi:glucose-6-phosphate isomerase